MLSVALNSTKLQEGWIVKHSLPQDKNGRADPGSLHLLAVLGSSPPHGHKGAAAAAFSLKSSLSPAHGWGKGRLRFTREEMLLQKF